MDEQPSKDFKKGDRVRIIDGVFKNHVGVVDIVDEVEGGSPFSFRSSDERHRLRSKNGRLSRSKAESAAGIATSQCRHLLVQANGCHARRRWTVGLKENSLICSPSCWGSNISAGISVSKST